MDSGGFLRAACHTTLHVCAFNGSHAFFQNMDPATTSPGAYNLDASGVLTWKPLAAGATAAPPSATPALIVNGDVGGTNARMQLWQLSASATTAAPPTLLCDVRYASASFDGIEPLVRRFLADAHRPKAASTASSPLVVDALCLAICGPVVDETRSAGPVLPEQGPTG